MYWSFKDEPDVRDTRGVDCCNGSGEMRLNNLDLLADFGPDCNRAILSDSARLGCVGRMKSGRLPARTTFCLSSPRSTAVEEPPLSDISDPLISLSTWDKDESR